MRISSVFLLLLIAAVYVGCGGEKKAKTASQEAAALGITPFELENGIGPIKEKLKLEAIDNAKVKAGEKLFVEKCSSCHKLDEKYVGPAQRDVVKRRSPEYIVNMIMNPQEMITKHPEAKKMLAQYMTPMAFQNVTVEDAIKILDYFRSVAETKN